MSDKNFVVVGGSHGIGLEMTRRLSKTDNVFVLSRSGESLSDLDRVKFVPFDAVADELDQSTLPDAIHGLAYCPGTLNLKSFRSLTAEQFREDFEVNVMGAVRVLQSLLPALKKGATESPASVLLFSTVAVGLGMPMHSSIAVSKGAIEGLMRSLASELSPQIRVNCLAPALTDTKLTERFFGSEKKVAALSENYAMKRTGTAADVAAIGCFLLGEESTWITGQVYGVDGGMSTIR